MPQEIERKYLPKNDGWKAFATKGTSYKQGYIPSENATVRIRIAGEKAFVTMKGKTKGISRSEFEYEIPVSDAQAMLDEYCDKPLVEKTRFLVQQNGKTWEVDVFEGENEGLVLAEIELESETESFDEPDWVGEEVSDDMRYYNSYLVKKPFKSWRA